MGGAESNLGVGDVDCLSTGKSNGIFTLMFETSDIQSYWLELLQKATGSYNIKDYYIVHDKHEE